MDEKSGALLDEESIDLHYSLCSAAKAKPSNRIEGMPRN